MFTKGNVTKTIYLSLFVQIVTSLVSLDGVDIHLDKNNQIFHAGTYEFDSKVFSKGGRVLNVTSSSKDLDEARNSSLSNLKKINWDSGFFRKDIGWRAIKKK